MFGEFLEALQADGFDMSWQDFANCRGADPDLFFPERGASTRTAKGICRECTVREECLNYALETNQEAGVWGGYAEDERRRLRKRWLAERRRRAS